MTARSRSARAALAALLGVFAVACGSTIPVDEEATALNPEQLNPVLAESTTTTTIPVNAELRRIYLIGEGENRPVMFSCPLYVEAQPTIDDDAFATLDRLIRTEPGAASSTCPSRLTNYVPTDLRVNATTVEGGTVTVALTGLAAVESSAQRQAVAQIVFTLTDLAGVERVIFFDFIDGRSISVPTGAGTSEVGGAVSRTDFPEYYDSPSTTTPTTTDPASGPPEGTVEGAIEPESPPEGA